ncbi:hypothetical protein D7X30_35380 [Corallococcus sp. AB011P]|uniref:hypothetical protein n=1 Tax=unclassified Corallococcus TaxID=2685029 RepID=UPI000EA14C36|nr:MULTISPECIES: hypothetical protein [unclassified Corallococcus]RKG51579.1 hypothetical protein D7X30_35380 [Corallococcus sp. AB011P]RKH83694.1 hypothetical protein D7Y21_26050 [Corallococcus sp. AB045]
MANILQFFMAPDDEVAFFRHLERHVLEVYPRRVPPDWVPFRANPDNISRLPEEDLYLVASEIGPAMVDKVKRGPDKGFWRIDEVRSPVIFIERSRRNEEGELLSGKMWVELEVTSQTGRRDAAPDKFRRLYMEVEEFVKKTFRRGDPKDFFVGNRAARLFKEGLVLRDSAFRGGTVVPHK